MKYHPEIAPIVAAMPVLPPFSSLDVKAFRAQINAGVAAAPRLDVRLADIADRTIPVPHGEMPIRIYTPEGQGPFPLLVYYHGGGYVIGNLDIADSICRSLASGGECVVMSVDYRLAPEHPFPAATDDAWTALRWAFANAGELDADPARVAVGGDSAGANLAAAMALKARDEGRVLTAQVLLYASPDYPDETSESFREYGDTPLLRSADALFYWDQYLADARDRDNPMAAPARASSHAGLAPACCVSAEIDPSRDLGERYAALLRAAGTEVEERRCEGMPHGFLNYIAFSPAVGSIMDDVNAWLRGKWSRPPSQTIASA